MKIKLFAITLALLAGLASLVHGAPLGTAFTYQGRLADGGSAANGNYDLRFGLFDNGVGGTQIGLFRTNFSVAVTGGLLTVTLDFGAGAFNGSARWLDIAVRTNGSAGTFTPMDSRQALTPSPHTIFSAGAGTVSNGVIQNPAFLGTIGSTPLQLFVNNQRALRLEPTAGTPNVIGGFSGNGVTAGIEGATIAGGGITTAGFAVGINDVVGNFGTVGGGNSNTAGLYGTIGGGNANYAGGTYATVGGGRMNSSVAFASTVSGGDANTNSGTHSAIGGGVGNRITGIRSALGGGYNNTVGGDYAVVPGGEQNSAFGDYSFAAGQKAKANHQGAFVWADSQNADFLSTANNQFLIRADGGVGIGNNNPQAPLHVSGGGDASLSAGGNFISGSASGQNVVIDNNEIISRNNGATADLILNAPGGNVGIGRTPAANALEVSGNASKTTAGNWLANSDARIKTEVQTVAGALDKLSRVRLVEFRYTDEYRAAHPGVDDRKYLNVVAQEFQKVFPEEVKRSGEKLSNGDDILQVDTYPLTIYSAAAVQELNRKLEEQKAESKEKDTRIGALERELSELKRAVMKLNDRN